MHKDEYFSTFIRKSLGPFTKSYSPILMTKSVYDGFKRACPDDNSIKKGLWSKTNITVKDYSGEIYGGNVIFTAINDI